MKIEINIDIEAIVREEIRNYVRENIVIKNVVESADIATVVAESQPVEETPQDEPVEAPQSGFIGKYDESKWKRRSPLKRALNAEEIRLGRFLTTEEEAAIEAGLELAEEKKEQVKQEIKKKAHYDEVAAEVTAEVEAEANEPVGLTVVEPVAEEKEPQPGDTVPEPSDLDKIDKLFS